MPSKFTAALLPAPDEPTAAIPVEKLGFEIKVVKGNILSYKADALAFKYSQSWSRLAQAIISKLPDDSVLIERPPREGDWLLVPSEGAAASRLLLLIGTPPRRSFSYDSMFQLARLSMNALAEADGNPPVRHLAITVHGLGWGFDEIESLKALILGFRAAVLENKYPHTLERISIVEAQAKRAELLQNALPGILNERGEASRAATAGVASLGDQVQAATPPATLTISPDVRSVPIQTPSLDEPFIFIAMPFANKYKDAFYYVIQPVVRELGYQVIRLDESSYTGDVVETIKQRIKAARLVIALLDGANPNVYLEVGFAWGVGTPTVLLLNKENEADVPFDVRSQKRLTYEALIDLRPILLAELRSLLAVRKPKGARPAPKAAP